MNHTRDAGHARTRDRQHVWHPWSPLSADRSELLLSHGAGSVVWDVDGKDYLDASSLNTTCGYARPEVEAAITAQVRQLHQFDLSLGSHEPAGLLAERLAAHLPPDMAKTLFVNSGSEGMEAAALITADYWSNVGKPRHRFVSFARGYHGSTLLTRSLSGLPRVDHGFGAVLDVIKIDLPLSPIRMAGPEALDPLVVAFERAFGDDEDDWPAAVVVEPVLNVGGGVVLPEGFLRELRRLCDRTGTLLVLDEVFTAYGRTGRMYAFQHEDATPDILVGSKALAGGYLPIGAVSVHRRIHDSFRDEPNIGGVRYGHTTSGHPVSCAAALATLDVVEKENLVARAGSLGKDLLDRLGPLAGRHEVVDVRGRGLIVVVELSTWDAAARLVERAKENGLLLRQPGEAVIVSPPLTASDDEIAAMADRLERSAAEAAEPAP
ncbi:adenosylmethionine-8-amino-7-oxononanoate aminotransferase [Saccharomonospora marina XMU15]|uniref:Adenosylmethionine-8-amino-7-oxononanoate aminotransferase n=1 Tax=Saccharomonospora marina XMU15 TaxID=882083 RepID=H5X7T6_9PSEU|nr:aminotransferase class III-fold pyridoxal phosphate-dependent enzyme [Saccharomonospora marina]EHR52436.1 adenosylmethionine-8-amino-7-oxononanoate aminotransferase [Saccharomonospora marina XMU15]